MCASTTSRSSNIWALLSLIKRVINGARKWVAVAPGKVLKASVYAAALLAASSAQAISGGNPSFKPWVVGVVSVVNGVIKTGCSGVAITAQLVVTAKHCPADAVVFDNRTATVSSRHDFPGEKNDGAILVLTAPHPLPEYPVLSSVKVSSLVPGMAGFVYGYGSAKPDLRHQRELAFRVTGMNPNGSSAIDINGNTETGDSGGPWVVDGKLIGIHSGKGVKPGQVRFDYVPIWSAMGLLSEVETLLRARAFIASEL